MDNVYAAQSNTKSMRSSLEWDIATVQCAASFMVLHLQHLAKQRRINFDGFKEKNSW